MISRKVCVVTGTRAEYGLLYPIMKRIQSSDALILQLIVTTMHLAEEFGSTYKQIEADGFAIDAKVENLLSADGKSSMAKSTGLAIVFLADEFKRLQPDIVLILGDRFETHAAATTAMLMNIPIAHVHGGEITEGAVDEQIRHSITKMSFLHFTSTETYRQRIIQMGEAPSRVVNSGAPGIDNIVEMNLLSKEDLESELDWGLGSKTALFTYHPETLSDGDVIADMDEILKALMQSDIHVLFTYANADDEGRAINQTIERFCRQKTSQYKVVKSLGQLKYLSAMKHVDLLIGNTSSGIIEAASFHKPVVNIGDRQKGRLQSRNVVDCTPSTLKRSIECALSRVFKQQCLSVKNIYGEGCSSETIVSVLKQSELSSVKEFVDVGCD